MVQATIKQYEASFLNNETQANMRKIFTRLFFAVCLLAASTSLFANSIVVKGHIQYNNGVPFAKHSVTVSFDSIANNTCHVSHTIITDSAGFYIDTLTCNADIKKIVVTTADCNGSMLTNIPTIITGAIYAESNFIVSCAAPAPLPPINCTDSLTYSVQTPTVKFNSKSSANLPGDSIISHIWSFGDSSTLLTGNLFDPSHQYTNPGIYNACLTIKTAKGCESKACISIIIPKNNTVCIAAFESKRISFKKAAFNSSLSVIAAGDSIVERNWSFGDGTTLGGNEKSLVKEFPLQGIYTICLKIKTAKGCESESCNAVAIQDSIVSAPGGTDRIVKIVTINPNPVTTRFAATVWSKNNNIDAEFSIYDIYGIKKWSTKKSLQQGNNVIEIFTGFLTSGSYFLRVITAYGTESRAFYKL